VRRQHGVVTRSQLLELGLGSSAIKHRVATGRLHPVTRGVYAVGRPRLGRHGVLIAAVLRCGPMAALSHEAGGELWQIRPEAAGPIEVSVPLSAARQVPGLIVHRRASLDRSDVTQRRGIPVTTLVCTMVDLAARLSTGDTERAINEADKRGLIDPDELRSALERSPRRPGVAILRVLLDRNTLTLTDSELERRFLPLARAAGLPRPLTHHRLNGFTVDFYWPELGLVVETDGLRYHRTPAQQARDRLRDQAHQAAGLRPLRFTHGQVVFHPDHVKATLTAVARQR
jgi:very-short-patch-repair endonuclease